MAKKLGTQVFEYLESLPVDDNGNVSMPAAKRDWCVKAIKVVDQRDEQKQKGKKTPALAAKRRKAKAR